MVGGRWEYALLGRTEVTFTCLAKAKKSMSDGGPSKSWEDIIGVDESQPICIDEYPDLTTEEEDGIAERRAEDLRDRMSRAEAHMASCDYDVSESIRRAWEAEEEDGDVRGSFTTPERRRGGRECPPAPGRGAAGSGEADRESDREDDDVVRFDIEDDTRGEEEEEGLARELREIGPGPDKPAWQTRVPNYGEQIYHTPAYANGGIIGWVYYDGQALREGKATSYLGFHPEPSSFLRATARMVAFAGREGEMGEVAGGEGEGGDAASAGRRELRERGHDVDREGASGDSDDSSGAM